MTDFVQKLEVDRIRVSVSVSAPNVGEMSTFGRHSVSAESNRHTFGALSVLAWCELYFRWLPKVSKRA